MFSSEANNCSPVIAAPVATAAELFGIVPPAIKLIFESTIPSVSSAGGGNAGAAYARGSRKVAVASFVMVDAMLGFWDILRNTLFAQKSKQCADVGIGSMCGFIPPFLYPSSLLILTEAHAQLSQSVMLRIPYSKGLHRMSLPARRAVDSHKSLVGHQASNLL